jgi:hypothetical protein
MEMSRRGSAYTEIGVLHEKGQSSLQRNLAKTRCKSSVRKTNREIKVLRAGEIVDILGSFTNV